MEPDNTAESPGIERLPQLGAIAFRFRGESESRSSEVSFSSTQEETTFASQKLAKHFKILGYTKQVLLIICWLLFTYFLMTRSEFEYEITNLVVPDCYSDLAFSIANDKPDMSLCLRLYGSFIKNTFAYEKPKLSDFDWPKLTVVLWQVSTNGSLRIRAATLYFYLAKQQMWNESRINMIEKTIEIPEPLVNSKYEFNFYSNINESLPLQLGYAFSKLSERTGLILIILGLLLLLLIYTAMMFEAVHRALAGVMCSTLAIGLLAALHLRPTQRTIFNEWTNIDIIMLFFGVSIIAELILETGVQDHLAALIYERAHGHIWPMLHYLLSVTCLLAIFFDEILLILFIAPICLRLSEIMQLDCTPVFSALIIAINVGSTLTPIGSMTNNFISNSPFLVQNRLGLIEFIGHMLPATLLTLAQSYIHLRLQFYNSEKMQNFEPFQVRRLRRLIKVWGRASSAMGDYTWDESLARKTVDRRVISLRKRLRRLGRMPQKPAGFEERVQNLRENFPIKKHWLLINCLTALSIRCLLTILAIGYTFFKTSKGWIAMLTALFALSMSAYEDIEGILSRIDWCTMLFSTTLSILVHALISLGLQENIGLLLEQFLMAADEQYRLLVAILVIIWVSAILTTFLNNAPVADMTMRIITTLSLNQDLNLPIMPLVWSLALGCALGGNGSIVAAVANIACAGVASRHGYRLTFFGYFKIGFFVMLGNVLVASCYLLLVHVAFQWH